MPEIMEVVAEYRAKSFPNTGKVAAGRIFKVLPNGPFLVDVDETVMRQAAPSGEHDTVDAAAEALFRFWDECHALFENGMPGWRSTKG